jgi:hypothetical protein
MMEYLKREAAAGHRAAFDRYLKTVPDVEPAPHDRVD